jgi:hypothetical protein
MPEDNRDVPAEQYWRAGGRGATRGPAHRAHDGHQRAEIVDVDHPDRVTARSGEMGVRLGATPGGYELVLHPPVEVVDPPERPPLPMVVADGLGGHAVEDRRVTSVARGKVGPFCVDGRAAGGGRG